MADLVPTEHHLKASWIMAYDLYPVQTLETKRQVLETAAAEEWQLVFEHSPTLASTRIRADGSLEK